MENLVCDLTRMIDTRVSDYDSNTILFGGDDNEYKFFSGFEIIKLSAEDKIIEFISVMGNNMIPPVIAIGGKTHISYLTFKNLLRTKELKKELYWVR